ncbi:MAG: sulfatase-like hydrolase/transferase [Bryobacterales bacterium]|nr:sulfatase-like hydrolase/transferase [Bryobacterales bacterium]
MSRRAFAGTLAAAATQVSCTEAPRRPNLLFVFSDQHRACSMPGEPYNDADAPNLARLASEGMTFRNCVSNYPVCSPYRGILLSGRWPHPTGIIDNNFPLRESEISLGETFRSSGYRTGYVGKWHLDATTPEGLRPEGDARHGFDSWRAWYRTSRHMQLCTWAFDLLRSLGPKESSRVLYDVDKMLLLCILPEYRGAPVRRSRASPLSRQTACGIV